jgi:hypothetical protein
MPDPDIADRLDDDLIDLAALLDAGPLVAPHTMTRRERDADLTDRAAGASRLAVWDGDPRARRCWGVARE